MLVEKNCNGKAEEAYENGRDRSENVEREVENLFHFLAREFGQIDASSNSHRDCPGNRKDDDSSTANHCREKPVKNSLPQEKCPEWIGVTKYKFQRETRDPFYQKKH